MKDKIYTVHINTFIDLAYDTGTDPNKVIILDCRYEKEDVYVEYSIKGEDNE